MILVKHGDLFENSLDISSIELDFLPQQVFHVSLFIHDNAHYFTMINTKDKGM